MVTQAICCPCEYLFPTSQHQIPAEGSRGVIGQKLRGESVKQEENDSGERAKNACEADRI